MAAKGFEQWIQQAGSVPPTKVAIPWLASWAHSMLLHGLWEAMTQFSVGVLPPWRHDIVITHPGEQPAAQKEIMSDRKGEFFHIVFYSEGERERRTEQVGSTDLRPHPSVALLRLVLQGHLPPCEEEARGKGYFTLLQWLPICKVLLYILFS